MSRCTGLLPWMLCSPLSWQAKYCSYRQAFITGFIFSPLLVIWWSATPTDADCFCFWSVAHNLVWTVSYSTLRSKHVMSGQWHVFTFLQKATTLLSAARSQWRWVMRVTFCGILKEKRWGAKCKTPRRQEGLGNEGRVFSVKAEIRQKTRIQPQSQMSNTNYNKEPP